VSAQQHPVPPSAERATEPRDGEVREGDLPSTGLAAVDEAVARLADLDERPVSEHHEVLAAVHEVLHAELQASSGRADD
jgi:hypothetical protein